MKKPLVLIVSACILYSGSAHAIEYKPTHQHKKVIYNPFTQETDIEKLKEFYIKVYGEEPRYIDIVFRDFDIKALLQLRPSALYSPCPISPLAQTVNTTSYQTQEATRIKKQLEHNPETRIEKLIKKYQKFIRKIRINLL